MDFAEDETLHLLCEPCVSSLRITCLSRCRRTDQWLVATATMAAAAAMWWQLGKCIAALPLTKTKENQNYRMRFIISFRLIHLLRLTLLTRHQLTRRKHTHTHKQLKPVFSGMSLPFFSTSFSSFIIYFQKFRLQFGRNYISVPLSLSVHPGIDNGRAIEPIERET